MGIAGGIHRFPGAGIAKGGIGIPGRFPGGGISIGIPGANTSANNAPLILTVKFPLPWVGLSGSCGCAGRRATYVATSWARVIVSIS